MVEETSLSSAGEARREEILSAARGEARRLRRRRWTAKAVAVGVTAALALALFIRPKPDVPAQHSIMKVEIPATRPIDKVIATAPRPPVFARSSRVVVNYLQTEVGIADRLAIPLQKPTWHQMSDDELLNQLAAAGRPAGLAWVDGREILLFRDMPLLPTPRHLPMQRQSGKSD